MRNFPQQNHFIKILAFAVLALALINISLPKIKEYNSAIYEEQIKLKIEANGNLGGGKVSFGIYVLNKSPNFNGVFTLILAALFLSLILTKKIILSFIFAFLLLTQITIFIIANIFLKIDYYFSDLMYFQLLFLAYIFSFSFWQALAICRFAQQKFQAKISLK